MSHWLKLPFVAILLTSGAIEASTDYEVIGRFRQKSYNGLASKIASQLFEESSNTDRLFESMNVELDLDLGPVNGKLRYSRSVNVDNPRINSDDLGLFDYSEYRVTNTIFTGGDAEIESGVLSASGTAGVFFGVSKKVVPRHSTLPRKSKTTDTIEEICKGAKEAFNPLLSRHTDNDNESLIPFREGSDFSLVKSADCKNLDSGFSGWFEKFAEQLNRPIRYIGMKFFADTEKTKMYLDQPVEAFTNYSRYGFPVDLDMFYENNQLLKAGDSIQHSVFYGWSPLNIGNDFGIGKFSFTVFDRTRAVRDIRILKETGNKVKVQVTDYLAKGSDWQFLKIRPRLLYIFKYSFADWRHKDFQAMTLKRSYLVDLAQGEIDKEGKVVSPGMRFLKKLVSSGWKINAKLSSDLLDKPEEVPAGVVALTPTYVEGPIAHKKFMLRFPGIFKTRKDEHISVQVARIGVDKAQAEAERTHSDERSWEATDWWFFKKTRQRTKCGLNTKTYATPKAFAVSSGLLSDRLALNIDCFHSEKYPDKNWGMLAWDTAQIMTDVNASPEFKEKMMNLDTKKVGDLKFTSNVSFNHKHLANFLSRADYDTVLFELAAIYFGDKYKKIWEKAGSRRVVHSIRNQYIEKSHSEFIPFASKKCENLNGLAGTIRGFAGLHNNWRQNCLDLTERVIFPMASDIAQIRKVRISDHREKVSYIKTKLERIINTYRSRDLTFALSILIQRLSGQTDSNPVHKTYSVDSNSFIEAITYSNGEPFRVEHESLEDLIPDVLDFKDTRNRIRNAVISKVKGSKTPSSIRLDLYSTHKFHPESILEVEVREYEAIIKNEDRTKIDRDLPAAKIIGTFSLTVDSLGKAKNLSDRHNDAKFVYKNIRIPSDRSWRSSSEGKTHVMYLRVKNHNQEWLSEETLVQFHWN